MAMGCGHSKLEEDWRSWRCGTAGRSDLLALATRHRYALAEADRTYAASLGSIDRVLHKFVHGVQTLPPPPPEPKLCLPAACNGDGLPAASPAHPDGPAIVSFSSAAQPPRVLKHVLINPDDEMLVQTM